MANILLIGGCGYIGSRLFQVLNEEHAVDSVDNGTVILLADLIL